MTSIGIPVLDASVLVCFFICWLGFGEFADWLMRRRPGLVSVVRVFRQRWIEQICTHENRIPDVMILANLLKGALFFASTAMFILGGLAALLGTVPKFNDILSQLPFAGPSEVWLSELKALALIFIFIYAFFKFTWSAWQYNVLAIIVGTAPAPGADPEGRDDFVAVAAPVAALAGDSYNHGIRAYYFSIAILGWFLHPLVFLAATLVITLVLYQREFASPTLAVLRKKVPRTPS